VVDVFGLGGGGDDGGGDLLVAGVVVGLAGCGGDAVGPVLGAAGYVGEGAEGGLEFGGREDAGGGDGEGVGLAGGDFLRKETPVEGEAALPLLEGAVEGLAEAAGPHFCGLLGVRHSDVTLSVNQSALVVREVDGSGNDPDCGCYQPHSTCAPLMAYEDHGSPCEIETEKDADDGSNFSEPDKGFASCHMYTGSAFLWNYPSMRGQKNIACCSNRIEQEQQEGPWLDRFGLLGHCRYVPQGLKPGKRL
jgi:hypothetical protein